MRPLLGKLFLLLRRPVVLVGGLILLVVLAAAGPYLWGWYHWSAAQSALARYQATKAQRHLQFCQWLWPNSLAVHLLAARADRRAGDLEAARTHLQKCQRLEPTPSEEVVLEWAMLHVAGGDLPKYEEYLQARVQTDPALAPLIWEALAVGYPRVCRIRDAMTCLEQWLTAEPDNVQALFLRGSLYRQLQVAQKYVPDLRRVVELDPERDDAREYLAGGLLEIGRFDEALGHLEHLLRRRPRDPELLVRLARCHNGLGHMKEARQLLDEVLAEHPDYGAALRAYGQITQQVGQLEEAERWFRRAGRVLPHDYAVEYGLYRVLEDEGKTAAAKEQLARTQELKDRLERLAEISQRKLSERPYDPALYYELGMLLISLGQEERGVGCLQTALRQDPNYQPAHAALADYYEKTKDEERAAYHREQVQSLPPPKPPPAKP
jgi:tetratricopeptide (TPR) repeat protein